MFIIFVLCFHSIKCLLNVFDYIVNIFDTNRESDEVRWAVNQINTRAREWMITYKLDVPFCIRQTLRGMPESRDLLKKIIADNEVAAECIHAVLASGIEFNKLFPEKGE